jgi:hypothetical protein
MSDTAQIVAEIPTKQPKAKRSYIRQCVRPEKPHNATVRKLFRAGLSEREIARATDLSKSSIHHIINRDFSQDQLEGFRMSEADSLDAFRMEYLRLVDQAAIKKMIDRRGMVDYAVAMDKAHLIRTGSDGSSKPMVQINIVARQTASNVDRPVDNSPLLTTPVSHNVTPTSQALDIMQDNISMSDNT